MQVIKDGKRVEVPDAEVGKRYLAGEIRLPSEGDIAVELPGQGIRRIAPQYAETAFAAGARAVSRAEEHKAYLEEHKNAGTFLQGLAFGALRGATLGLSDPLIKAISPEAGAHIADIKEQHPIASFAGEAVPLVASMFATGGATAPEAAASLAAARGVGVAEGAAGAVRGAAAAERLIGAGGQVAERSLATLPRAVTAGREAEAVAGAARAAQESRGVAHAALDAFTFAPRKVAQFGQLAERAVADVVGRGSTNFAVRLGQQALTRGAGTAAEGALFSVGHTISEASLGDHDLNAEKLMSSALHGALLGGAVGAGFGAFGEMAGTGAKAVLKKMSIGKKADEMAFSSLEPTAKIRAEATKVKGGEAAIGQTLLKRDLIKGTLKESAAAIGTDRAAVGSKLGELMDTIDTAAIPGARPQVTKIYRDIMTDVVKPLSMMPGQEALAKQVTDFANSFFRKASGEPGVAGGEVGLKRLWEIRKTLDKDINWTSTKQVKDVMAHVRGILDDEVARVGEEAANKVGAGFAKDYKAIKTEYQHLSIADKAAQKAILKTPSGFASTTSGLGLGLAGGILAGSGPLGIATGIGAKMAHGFIKERGRSTVAVVFDKLASYAGLRKAVVSVDHQVDEAIAKLVGSERVAPRHKLPSAAHSYGDTDERYEKATKSVSAAAANPEAFKRHVAEYAAPLGQHAPETEKAMQASAGRVVTYLASKLPKGRVEMNSLTPHLDVAMTSDKDKAEFLRHVDGATNYPKVLKELSKGQLTPEHVEAMKAGCPKALAELQQKTMKALASMKTPVAYPQRVQLGLLLDIPSDITMTPKFVLSMQKQYPVMPPPKQNSPGRGGGRSKGGNSLSTTFTPRQ